MCARTPACARVCARVCMCIHLCVCGVFLDARAFVMPHVACHVSCHAACHVRDVQIANQPPCLMCRVISSTSTYKAERGPERIQRLSVCLSTCINMHLHVIQSAHQPHIFASRPPTSHITPPTSHITPATSHVTPARYPWLPTSTSHLQPRANTEKLCMHAKVSEGAHAARTLAF